MTLSQRKSQNKTNFRTRAILLHKTADQNHRIIPTPTEYQRKQVPFCLRLNGDIYKKLNLSKSQFTIDRS